MATNGPVLVTGGTGMLGRAVVAELVGRGLPARVLSRRPGVDEPAGVERVVGDLTTGAGLDAAVDGVTAVIHCASAPGSPQEDVVAAGRLLLAARQAGVPHLVYISIVGVDAIPYSYYRAKLEVEELIAASDVPWTILRTTQFHQFVPPLLQRLTVGGVTIVPSATSVQPVDVGEVAARLVDLATGEPAGRVRDVGGPQVLTVDEAIKMLDAARGEHRRTVHVRLPGKSFAAIRAGHHLTPDHATGTRTFAEAVTDEAPA